MRHYRPGPNIKSSIPNRAKVKAVLKELPLSKVRSRIDIDQEPSETEIAAFRDDKNEGPSDRSSAKLVDDALLLDLPPLQLTQAPERRPQVPVAAEMSGNEKNKVPVIVWMDDEQPIEEKVAALPSKIRIDQDAWDPFSGDVKPAEALEFATVSKRPNGEKSSERATAWNPQRDRELPLRLGESMDATRTPSRKQTLAGQAGLESSDVRMRAASQSTPIPRIYLQQASNTQQ